MNIYFTNKKTRGSANRMVAILAITVFTLLSISCVPSTKSQDNEKSILDIVLETGVLKVGTTSDWIPVSYLDTTTGKNIGRDIDIVEELAKDMGVEIEYVKTDWKNLVSGISANRYQLTTSASYNVGRAKTVGYTNPISSIYTVAIIKKELEGQFATWNDLNSPSITVAVSLGTIFDEVVQELLPQATIIRVEAPARDYQEVIAKKADVSLTSNIEGAELIKKYPNDIAMLPSRFPSETPLGLLTQRGDQEFINYLNTWIQLKTSQGFFESVDEKWLSSK